LYQSEVEAVGFVVQQPSQHPLQNLVVFEPFYESFSGTGGNDFPALA
jgi:hypothetical protein